MKAVEELTPSVGTAVACEAFESAGYALRGFLDVELTTRDMSQANAALQYSLVLRGLLSPFGHVVWTAMTAGALWRVVHDGPLRSSSFADWRFASPFIAAVLIHFTWNSGLLDSLPFFAKYMVLGVIAWTISFGLLLTGFREAAAGTRQKS